MDTMTNPQTIKRGNELVKGDRIKGTSTYDSTAVEWTVMDVRPKVHPVLGDTVQVNVAVMIDGYADDNQEFFVKPYQRLWVLA